MPCVGAFFNQNTLRWSIFRYFYRMIFLNRFSKFYIFLVTSEFIIQYQIYFLQPVGASLVSRHCICNNITCFYHMLAGLIICFSCSPKMNSLAGKKTNITWHYNSNLKCTDSVLHYNVAWLAVAWMLWMLLPCDWEARKMCLVKVREQGKGQVEKEHVGSMKHTWVSTVKGTDRSDRAIFYISSRASSVMITCRPTAN